MDTVTGQLVQDTFRLSSPESRRRLDELLGEFGVQLSDPLGDNFAQLIENLLWRETGSAGEFNEGRTLLILLDLGEGDEVILATVRAGEISAFSHTEL
jgi:hypothetical protein